MGIVIIDGGYETDKTLVKKREYCDYIIEHQVNVAKAFIFLNTPSHRERLSETISEINDEVFIELEDQISKHDLSKLSDYEFNGYRVKFFPTDDEKVEIQNDEEKKLLVEQAFNEAWHHHYTNNSHHPLYWKWRTPDGEYLETEREEAYDMDIVSILHMICDWYAMSLKFNNNVLEWFNEKAIDEKKAMSPKTLDTVNNIMKNLFQ